MGILGLVILIALSLILICSLVFKNGWGAKNYLMKNIAGIYVFCLGLLSVMKATTNGMEEGIYLGFLGLIISILTLFVFKKNYKMSLRLNILGIIVVTVATYFSYMN